jgi:hypothetical protein
VNARLLKVKEAIFGWLARHGESFFGWKTAETESVFAEEMLGASKEREPPRLGDSYEHSRFTFGATYIGRLSRNNRFFGPLWVLFDVAAFRGEADVPGELFLVGIWIDEVMERADGFAASDEPFIELTPEYFPACSGDECRQTLFGEANVIPPSVLRGEFIVFGIGSNSGFKFMVAF